MSRLLDLAAAIVADLNAHRDRLPAAFTLTRTYTPARSVAGSPSSPAHPTTTDELCVEVVPLPESGREATGRGTSAREYQIGFAITKRLRIEQQQADRDYTELVDPLIEFVEALADYWELSAPDTMPEYVCVSQDLETWDPDVLRTRGFFVGTLIATFAVDCGVEVE